MRRFFTEPFFDQCPERIFFWTHLRLRKIFMFCELAVFLCFTGSNIVCGEGKGHTETIGVSGNILNWITDFLDSRTQRVVIYFFSRGAYTLCHHPQHQMVKVLDKKTKLKKSMRWQHLAFRNSKVKCSNSHRAATV